jgi:hypothetical protein
MCTRRFTRRELLNAAGKVQCLVGVLLICVGWTTMFVGTAVGATTCSLGLVATLLTRSDATLLNARLFGMSALSTLWLVGVAEPIAALMCAGLAGFSTYVMVEPVTASPAAYGCTAASIAFAVGGAMVAMYIRVNQADVVEAVYAAAALHNIRRLRYAQSASTAPVAVVSNVVPPPPPPPPRLARPVASERKTNILADFPQVQRALPPTWEVAAAMSATGDDRNSLLESTAEDDELDDVELRPA